jgi:hypothetical protein
VVLNSIFAIAIVMCLIPAIAAFRSSTIRIQRSREIHAPAETVFGLINDFHPWPAWAPQDQADPTMVRTFSGSRAGPGAVSEQLGSSRSGRGRMVIVHAEPTREPIMLAWNIAKCYRAKSADDAWRSIKSLTTSKYF